MGGCLLFLFLALAWLKRSSSVMANHGVYGFALFIVLCHLSASRFQDLIAVLKSECALHCVTCNGRMVYSLVLKDGLIYD